jgi:hypothetical protein
MDWSATSREGGGDRKDSTWKDGRGGRKKMFELARLKRRRAERERGGGELCGTGEESRGTRKNVIINRTKAKGAERQGGE